MKEIWTQKQAEYHGELVDFDPIFAWPKPTQKPHPPIHVGGAFPGGMRRALRYGDGWIPISGRGDGDPIAHLPAFREEAAKLGRSLDALRGVGLRRAARRERAATRCATPASRAPSVLRAAGGKDDVLKLLDGYAEAARKVA